jgi:beta-mannosidase
VTPDHLLRRRSQSSAGRFAITNQPQSVNLAAAHGRLRSDPNSLYTSRFNERKLDWVRDDTWTFTRRFTLASPWAGGELVLAGVDTVADVTLNGRSLGRVANEHRTHRFSLPADALRGNGDGQNQLSIKLKPVKSEAQKDAAAYAYAVPSTAHFGSFAEHKGFIRKAGSDFGWCVAD